MYWSPNSHSWLPVEHPPLLISPSTIITLVQALIIYYIFYWKSIPIDLAASSFFSLPNSQFLPHCFHETYIWWHISHAQTSLSTSLYQSKVHTPPSSLGMKCLLVVFRKIHSFAKIPYLRHDMIVSSKGKEEQLLEKEQEEMVLELLARVWTPLLHPLPQYTHSPF